jgi:hypothetical protein
MMRVENDRNTPETWSKTASPRALFLNIVRLVVEKHGGTMQTDPVTHNTYISIPHSHQAICLKELAQLRGHAGR